ncbi:6467_t:CDS:1, partial [Entrophospora sp. SA101]
LKDGRFDDQKIRVEYVIEIAKKEEDADINETFELQSNHKKQ